MKKNLARGSLLVVAIAALCFWLQPEKSPVLQPATPTKNVAAATAPQNLPEQKNPLEQQQPLTQRADVVEQGISRSEFKKQLRKEWRVMEKALADFARLDAKTQEEVSHFAPPHVFTIGEALTRVDELAAAQPDFFHEVEEFYLACAEENEFPLDTRAVCLSLIKQLRERNELAFSIEAYDLPERVIYLAHRLE